MRSGRYRFDDSIKRVSIDQSGVLIFCVDARAVVFSGCKWLRCVAAFAASCASSFSG